MAEHLLLTICHNGSTQHLHGAGGGGGGEVDVITLSVLNENHKYSFFHSLISADSLFQTQPTAGNGPVNAKEEIMTFNTPEK